MPIRLPAIASDASSLAAASDRASTLARAATDRATNAAFVEPWTDLAQWALYGGNGGAQASGGRLYSNGAGGGSAGLNHAFPVPSGGTFRAVFVYRSTGNLDGSGVFVGVSSDAPGAPPAQFTNSARGLYFADNGISRGDRGSFTALTDNKPTPGTFVVAVVGDGTTLSVVARRTSDGQEWETTFNQNDAAIGNLYLFNTDTRGLSGDSIGTVGAKLGLATLPSGSGVESFGATAVMASDERGDYRIAFPQGFDSLVGAPVIVCHHGDSSDRSTWVSEPNAKVVADGLLAAGYVVVSASASANNRTWGAGQGLDAYAGAYAYFAANYTVGKVGFYANSMGGIESELGLAGRNVPEVLAWVGTSPTASLSSAYANGQFQSAIAAAYGVSGDYGAKTAGHDPLRLPGYAFRGVPMFALYATDDATIPPDQNWLALKPNVAPFAKEIREVATTGGHGFDFTPHVGEIVGFFDKHLR